MRVVGLVLVALAAAACGARTALDEALVVEAGVPEAATSASSSSGGGPDSGDDAGTVVWAGGCGLEAGTYAITRTPLVDSAACPGLASLTTLGLDGVIDDGGLPEACACEGPFLGCTFISWEGGYSTVTIEGIEYSPTGFSGTLSTSIRAADGGVVWNPATGRSRRVREGWRPPSTSSTGTITQSDGPVTRTLAAACGGPVTTAPEGEAHRVALPNDVVDFVATHLVGCLGTITATSAGELGTTVSFVAAGGGVDETQDVRRVARRESGDARRGWVHGQQREPAART
jgi:hypothetical protein